MAPNDVDKSGPAPWLWWVAVAAMGAAVVVDAIDGEPLKLATSVLLLVAFVTIAATQRRRTTTAKAAIGAAVAGATAVLLYRLFAAGL